MRDLARHSPDELVDLLGERMAFERESVVLYDAIVLAVEMSNDDVLLATLPALRLHRDEEREHERWLEAQIDALGADAGAETALARVAAIEVSGFARIVVDGDDDPAHLFHALYAAELADRAGWEVLVALAHDAGDRDARRAFERRAREEARHVAFARRVVECYACARVLGEELALPA